MPTRCVLRAACFPITITLKKIPTRCVLRVWEESYLENENEPPAAWSAKASNGSLSLRDLPAGRRAGARARPPRGAREGAT